MVGTGASPRQPGMVPALHFGCSGTGFGSTFAASRIHPNESQDSSVYGRAVVGRIGCCLLSSA